MSPSEYQDLVEFLAQKFDRIDVRFEAIDRRFEAIDRRFDQIDQRFDRLEDRVTRVEIGLEGLRDDLRQVAEGVVANGQRIDRLERLLEAA